MISKTILPIKSPYHSYIYDANRNSIIRVSDDLYDFILSGDMKVKNSEAIKIEIMELQKNGYLIEPNISSVGNIYEDDYIEYYLNHKLNMLTLQITQRCNFRCNYCQYTLADNTRAHSNLDMTWDIAKSAIDFFASRVRDSMNVNIAFYGGEPLLQFDFIKKCVEYANICLEGKNISHSLTTNASLLNESIMDYFVQHNFNILVSLDGPKEINDYNRKFAHSGEGTFDTVYSNLKRVLKSNPNYKKNIGINSVIDPMRDYLQYRDFLMDKMFDNMQILTPTVDPPSFQKVSYSKDFYINRNYDQYLELVAYITNSKSGIKSPIAKRYLLELQHISEVLSEKDCLPQKVSHSGPCLPGERRLFVNVHGDFFPCEKVSETLSCMKIGNIRDGFDLEAIKRILNISSVTEDKCKECWALRFCDTCVRVAVDTKGINRNTILRRCRQIKHNVEQLFSDIITINEISEMSNNQVFKEIQI